MEEKKQSLDDLIDKELVKHRRIFFSGGVDEKSAQDVIRKLWYLESIDPGKPILLVINSPGGSVDAGYAVWDQITMITSPVTTLVTGIAASMGSILSLAAAPGRRFSTPNARIMIHQPAIHGVIQGQATDLEIQAKEIIKTRKQIINTYVEKTGQDYATIDRAIDRDNWLGPEEAKAFGLLDGIVTSFADL